MPLPTKERLDEILAQLQMLLRVQDIDVTVKLKNEDEMKGIAGDEFSGFCYVYRKHNDADILINTDSGDNEDDNWYRTLVHELLHIMFDGLENLFNNGIEKCIEKDKGAMGCLWEVETENLINRLAKIFVEIYPLESLEDEMEDTDA